MCSHGIWDKMEVVIYLGGMDVSDEKIKSIADYIGRIEKEIDAIPKDKIVVFRGEVREFKRPCYPNLFRERILEDNPFFEKNQFDEMAANKLTKGETYLEKAIDAQHGGFPSRLLDVTYNCLAALYFAVTPYYHKPEDSSDDEDGVVYIFPIDKMYCPTANNIINAYDMIVERKENWINEERIFQKNHKLIDHIKLNPRIIAQQGAFLLFQGDDGEEMPCYSYLHVKIEGKYKKKLREQLRQMCGIHTGSIYPENYNLVNEISRKARSVSAREFSIQSELDLVISNLKKCMEYYVKELEDKAAQREEYLECLIEAERTFDDYREGISSLEPGQEKGGYDLSEKKEEFNECIQEFYRELEKFSPKGIEFSEEYLLF